MSLEAHRVDALAASEQEADPPQAQPPARHADGGGRQPAAQGFRPADVLEVAEQADEHVLDDVVDFVLAPEEAKHQARHEGGVLLEQLVELAPGVPPARAHLPGRDRQQVFSRARHPRIRANLGFRRNHSRTSTRLERGLSLIMRVATRPRRRSAANPGAAISPPRASAPALVALEAMPSKRPAGPSRAHTIVRRRCARWGGSAPRAPAPETRAPAGSGARSRSADARSGGSRRR